MVAATVTAQNTRIFDGETLTGVAGIGGGAGPALETDFKYENNQCIARKGATGERGIDFTAATTQNLQSGTYSTLLVKMICTTPGLLDTKATQAFAWRVGTASGVYHQYDLQGSDTYPITRSWLIVAIDPNVAAHRSSTSGAPNLTAVDYHALVYDQSGTSKSPNQGFDAIDLGAGLTITGGTGGDPDATWEDLLDFDWGIATNRFGYVQDSEGIRLITGKIVRGGAPTNFTDSGKTIVFVDGLFAAGFAGIDDDLTDAAAVISETGNTYIGRGSAAGEDTRPVYTANGTAGSAIYSSCSWVNWASIALNSAVDINGNTFRDSGTVTQGGAQLTEISIENGTGIGLIADDLTKTDGLKIRNCVGTGLDLTGLAATSFTLSDVEITGNASGITVNNAADVTINLGQNASVQDAVNIGAGNVQLLNSKTLTLTSIPTGSRVSIIRASDNTILSETLNSGTSYVYGYEHVSDIPVFIRIISFTRRFYEIDYTLTAEDATIPITTNNDRVAINP